MKTLNLKTGLMPAERTETTCNAFLASEGSDALEFTTVNQMQGKAVQVMRAEFGEVGFERKSDWMRFVNKLNNYDETPIKRIATGDKKSCDWGGVTISRENIEFSEDGFLLEYDEPVKVILETIGENFVFVEAKKLRGKITWEWHHYRNEMHADLGNYAGVCEIYIYGVEIIE